MMDWTDRHCRYFHRLLSKHARLYTEMVTTGALRHGSVQRHLRFNAEEHPVALQLGGSDAADLAHAAKLGQEWGYDEINLNCGCPSDRVQRGAFGACLMNEPRTVADGVKAMLDVVDVPVTVKHRIGIDRVESYDFVRDFVGEVSEAGCKVFIVHARNAWLDGLSPKENREIPPLRYELAYQLKKDFPSLVIAVNGGIKTNEDIALHLQHADGVMVGRVAYYNPWLLGTWDATFFGDDREVPSRERWKRPWWPIWSEPLPKTAALGMRLPGTCWACTTASAARVCGDRSGATTSSNPCRRVKSGYWPERRWRVERNNWNNWGLTPIN